MNNNSYITTIKTIGIILIIISTIGISLEMILPKLVGYSCFGGNEMAIYPIVIYAIVLLIGVKLNRSTQTNS